MKTNPYTLFEVSWEVCNKVGGIHTVVSTKAKSLVDRLGDDYVAVGPWVLKSTEENHEFEEESGFQPFIEACRALSLEVRVGRWRIPGRPRTILIEFSRLYERKDGILAGLWEDFQVDSIHGSWDYVEPVLFGHAAALVIERFWEEFLAPEHKRAVVNAHEWMTSSALLYLKRHVPSAGTVFTTHATVLGRTLSSHGQSPDDGLGDTTPAALAQQHNVVAKHSLESIAAREADVFTTVSEITAKEATLLLGRTPAPLTTNGLDVSVVDELAGPTKREDVRRALLDTASRFFGEDVADAALVAVSGRYEFHNKGIDVLLEAMARLDGGAGQRAAGRRIVLFVLVPAGNSGLRSEFIERRKKSLDEIEGPLGISTHNLFDPEHDPVHEHCARLGLDNAADARVRVIQVPIYLAPGDGLWSLPYQAVLRAFDLTCFPSYYEPWGYTPQESLAVGVPTITSDYAGFGRWARASKLGPANGVTVIDRVHIRHEDVVARLADAIERQLADGRSARELEGICRETAQRSTWAQFLPRYEEAYATALEAVQKRLETGVLQTRRPKLPLAIKPAIEGKRPHLYTFDVAATLPASLRGLAKLARNLWWSWDHEATALFAELSPRSWEASGHNPVSFLQRVYPEDLAAKAGDPRYVERLERTLARFDAYLAVPFAADRWRTPAGGGPTPERPVAYFCAEYGVHESLRIYSGGLGVLAGDHVKSASDLALPLVAIGLFYRMGYTSQRLGPGGEQLAVDVENDPRMLPLEAVKDESGSPLEIELPLPGRTVRLSAWRVRVGRVTLYLLDSNRPENRPEDRDITRNLYGGGDETRLLQEICLGRGGHRLLRRLGIRPSVFHMNEGHAAFLTLERVSALAHEEGLTFDEARELVRATTLFTTHTPVPAGHDRFNEDLMRRHFSDAPTWLGVPWERFMALGQAEGEQGTFNMTYLALGLASFANGVSDMHGIASQKLLKPLWPGLLGSEVPVDAIVNGIHLPSWTSPEIASVLGATERPIEADDFARPLDQRGLSALRDAKRELRRRMLDEMRTRLSRTFVQRGDSPVLLARLLDGLDPNALWIGFARRFAPYKRALLLFQDAARLEALLSDPDRPVRIVFAGKAHPQDGMGKDLVKKVFELSRRPEFQGRVYFLEDYDVALARALVQGVDVWLNTPTRWLEASGTSGMKAAANGTLNLSIGDGWWPEAFDGDNGWLFGGGEYRDQALQDQFDASTLYRTLEEEVVPDWYERDASGRPARWLARMQHCLATVPLRFNTDRMVRDYFDKAYAPLAASDEELGRSKRAKLKLVVQENQRIRKGFADVRIASAQVGDLSDLHVGDPVTVRVEVGLGGLAPSDIVVELVLGHASNGDLELASRTVVALSPVGASGDLQAFEGLHETERSGSFAYGIRVRARTEREHAGSLRDLVLWA